VLVAAAGVLIATLIISYFVRVDVTVGGLALTAQRADRAGFPVPGDEPAAGPRLPDRAVPAATSEAPRNVVLVIGDGMGLGQVVAASTLTRGPAGGLALEAAPVIGLVRTGASDDLVTDSAASASAMATGFQTPRKALSRLPDGGEPLTLFEAAAERGLATGAVTTSGLVDATPAAFLVHAGHRDQYRTILEQMLHSDATVLIGGDWSRYRKALRQRDYLELMRDAESAADARFRVVRDATALATAAAPVLALLPPRTGSRHCHGPSLEVSVRRALDLLDDSPAGFLLMIEQENTDESAHDNDTAGVVESVVELMDALELVLDLAAERQDTLVLVTADHDTGGLAITDGDFAAGVAELRWSSGEHTSLWVPLFAFGPGAPRFAGVYDNTEIGRRIAELLGLDGFPPAS
jgi:alkaline phosphatase